MTKLCPVLCILYKFAECMEQDETKYILKAKDLKHLIHKIATETTCHYAEGNMEDDIRRN